MTYISTVKPVSTKLMREVYLYAFGKDYNTDTTWMDLGVAYKYALRSLNSGAVAKGEKQ